MSLYKRKKMRLSGYDYSQNGAYFITICVKGRVELLGRTIVGRDAPGAPTDAPDFVELTEFGMIVHREIAETSLHYEGITIDKFVVMPNHIHMIVVVNRGKRRAEGVAPYNNCFDTNHYHSIEKKDQSNDRFFYLANVLS